MVLLALAPASGGANTVPNDPAPREAQHAVRNADAGAERNREQNEGRTMPDRSDDGGRVRLERAERLQFSSATRISVATDFSADMVAPLHLAEGSERAYANRVSDACVAVLRTTGRPSSIVASPGRIADNGSNVMISLAITPNARGGPYRVTLTASQSGARWSASIERPGYRHVPGNIPIRPDGTTPDGRPYWDAARDTDTLAKHLCNHLLSGGSNANGG
jgi:hypothetical protein